MLSFVVECTGPPLASAQVVLRRGAAWSTHAPLWSGTIQKSGGTTELVNTPVQGVDLVAGAKYVLEVQGNGSGPRLTGTFLQPNNHLYPLVPWANQSPMADAYRVGFETYLAVPPRLMIFGNCGGWMTVEASNFAPNLPVMFVWSRAQGASTNPFWRCRGIGLGLAELLHFAGIPLANAGGIARLSRTIPLSACGQAWVQAVGQDVFLQCSTTNVLLIQ